MRWSVRKPAGCLLGLLGWPAFYFFLLSIGVYEFEPSVFAKSILIGGGLSGTIGWFLAGVIERAQT